MAEIKQIKVSNTTYDIRDDSKVFKLIETTYSALKTLITNSQLVPGQFYKITDYVTTSAQINTNSAGHVFDIIVQAFSNNKLNEIAQACLHSGDTYFANYNLAGWELKYDINNDTDKYSWADTTNGKGVIYYLKDEFNNEARYDFKNIRFLGSSLYNFTTGLGSILDDTKYYYTFSHIDDSDNVVDFSLWNGEEFGDGTNCQDNHLNCASDDDLVSQPNGLNFICLISPKGTMNDLVSNYFTGSCYSITVYTRCQFSKFNGANKIYCYGTFEGCDFNICNTVKFNCNGNYVIGAKVGVYCNNNTINSGDVCYNLTFSNTSNNNTITASSSILDVSFEDYCGDNTFIATTYIRNLYVKGYCYNNSFTSTSTYINNVKITNVSHHNTISASSIGMIEMNDSCQRNTLTTTSGFGMSKFNNQVAYVTFTDTSTTVSRIYIEDCCYLSILGDRLKKSKLCGIWGTSSANPLLLSNLPSAVPNTVMKEVTLDINNNFIVSWNGSLLAKAGYYTTDNGSTWTQITPVETYE